MIKLLILQLALGPVVLGYDTETPSFEGGDYFDRNGGLLKKQNFRVYSDEITQLRCLDAMNQKRLLHESTPILILGANFTKYTIDRGYNILEDIESNNNIKKGKYPFGESFFWYYDPNSHRSAEEAVDVWYNESRLYDYHKPRFNSKTGGFTQLVWKSSREASCIKIEYESRSHLKTLIVANFWPAGNVEGEFPYNVMPLKKSSKPDYSEDYPPRPRPPYDDRPKPTSRPDYDRPRPTSRPDYDRPPVRPDYERPPYPPVRPDYERPPYPPVRPDYERPPYPPVRPDYERPPYPSARPRPVNQAPISSDDDLSKPKKTIEINEEDDQKLSKPKPTLELIEKEPRPSIIKPDSLLDERPNKLRPVRPNVDRVPSNEKPVTDEYPTYPIRSTDKIEQS